MKKHDERFVALCEQSKSSIEEISLKETLSLLSTPNPPLFIDVREDHEWEKGFIPGAIHLGKGIIERDIGKHCQQSDAQIILYCGGGYRSALAAESLQKMGYNSVFSMAGGYRGWRESREP